MHYILMLCKNEKLLHFMTQQVVYVNEFNPCIDFFQGQSSYLLSKDSFSCQEGEKELIDEFSGKLLDYVKNVAGILELKVMLKNISLPCLQLTL